VDRSFLFLADSIIESRRKLYDQVEAGKITEERASLKALELIPDDHPALSHLTALSLKRGKMEAAGEYSRRNIAAHPWSWSAYLQASELAEKLGDTFLADGLAELAVRKMASDEDALREMPTLRTREDRKLAALSREERLQVFETSLRKSRDLEPPETTAFLRPHRLFQSLLESESLDADGVDAIVSRGQPCLLF
jgi:hypothetical protein